VFLGAKDLEELLPSCIDKESFNPKRISQAAYELSLGAESFATGSEKGKSIVLDEKNKTVEINPGQFALLLTKETITIPKKYLAFISVKAGEKLKGLINVSGFHVDPGFTGKLVFSVYNAGPSVITLKKDEPYFLIWFSQLKTDIEDKDAYSEKNNHHQNQNGIPTKYIDALKSGNLASPNVLSEQIKSNDFKLERVFWAFGILVAITGAILAKVYTDSSKVKDAYEAGLKEKTATEEVKSAIEQSHLNYIISCKVDSILKEKGVVK
jgi:dCTP deaminase